MKKNNKGFTLAELLIVVAIIAVLVAIAIPVFTSQLEKSREATDLANVRSAYSSVVMQYLNDGKTATLTVESKQTQNGWQSIDGTPDNAVLSGFNESGTKDVNVPYHVNGAVYTITISAEGVVSVT